MDKPVIILVGADKGGVGKTNTCRALMDYFAARGVQFRAFDSEHPKGDLKGFYPAAEVIDLAAVKDQMKVFDEIENNVVTIVDIRAGVLSQILRTLDAAHILDDVRNGSVTLVILHVLGPSMSSLYEIAETASSIGAAAKHLIVKNHINDTQYDLAADPKFAETFKAMESGTINIPKLTEMACEAIQRKGCAFTAFARGDVPGGSRMLRGLVRTWFDQVSAEFDRVGIPRIIGT